MKKEKMPVEKKLKLIYSGELALFFLIFGVLGCLFVFGVITPADWKRYAFTYVTLVGATWIIADFIWALASKKRRKKVCILDKALVLPVAPVLIAFDIYCIIHNCAETLPYRYFIGFDLIYLSLVYLFQAIYHYFKPTKQMQDIIAEALKPEPEEKEEDDQKVIEAEAEEKPVEEVPVIEEKKEE